MVTLGGKQYDSAALIRQCREYAKAQYNHWSALEALRGLARSYRRATGERRDPSHHAVLDIRRRIGITLKELLSLYHQLNDAECSSLKVFIQLEVLADHFNKQRRSDNG